MKLRMEGNTLQAIPRSLRSRGRGLLGAHGIRFLSGQRWRDHDASVLLEFRLLVLSLVKRQVVTECAHHRNHDCHRNENHHSRLLRSIRTPNPKLTLGSKTIAIPHGHVILWLPMRRSSGINTTVKTATSLRNSPNIFALLS